MGNGWVRADCCNHGGGGGVGVGADIDFRTLAGCREKTYHKSGLPQNARAHRGNQANALNGCKINGRRVPNIIRKVIHRERVPRKVIHREPHRMIEKVVFYICEDCGKCRRELIVDG